MVNDLPRVLFRHGSALLLLAVFAAKAYPAGAVHISSDKASYMPGDTLTLTVDLTPGILPVSVADITISAEIPASVEKGSRQQIELLHIPQVTLPALTDAPVGAYLVTPDMPSGLYCFTISLSAANGVLLARDTREATVYHAAEDLIALYEAACANAKERFGGSAIALDEIRTDLTPVLPDNADLTWQGGRGNTVECVMWKYSSWWDGQSGATSTDGTWFVTVTPDVGRFVEEEELTEDDVTLRLEQALGISATGADADGKWFVVLWVNKKDLFRPSPDVEISDRQGERYFRDTPFLVLSEDLVVDGMDYRSWFEHRKLTVYDGSETYYQNYPWTGVGYTYDWGSQTDQAGLSEFCIREGAAVEIIETKTTRAYFGF